MANREETKTRPAEAGEQDVKVEERSYRRDGWKAPRELALPFARAVVSRELRGFEIPESFAQASVASAANAYERSTKAARAARRRLNDKVNALIALNSRYVKGT